MDIEVDEDLLRTVASGGQMDYGLWPTLSQGIITRLDKIAHNDFPIPNLPPPRQRINPPDQHPQPPLLSSSGPPDTVGDPSSQDADKENAQPKSSTTSPTAADGERDATIAAPLAPGSLPAQIEAMLTEINTVLATFPKYPPHTIQRLAELVIEPRRHYRQLASYLHAVDRVVHVTSGANVYPLPPAVPDVSAMTLLSNGTIANGGGSSSSGGSSSPQDPAAAVSWGNTANSAASTIGTDEALGGALLTPIPWLTRRPSPGSASPASSGGGSSNNGPAEIRTESTETIDGPNGVGSIETVSVSVNGIPSMGAAMSHINTAAGPAGRGITQGELLRQEQEQGVVPVNQLVRQTEEAQLHAAALRAAGGAGNGGSDGGNADSPERQQQQQQQLSPDAAAAAAATAEDETETPHARGPEEIGVDDLGPQSVTTSFVGGPGVEMQGIDVEAAVGRKAEPPASSSPDAEDSHTEDASSVTMDADTADDDAASETSTTSHAKRDANEELEEGLASKKIKEDEGDVATAGEDAAVVKKEEEEVKVQDAEAPKAEPEDEEMKMEEVKEEDEKKPLAEEEEKKTRTAPPAGIE